MRYSTRNTPSNARRRFVFPLGIALAGILITGCDPAGETTAPDLLLSGATGVSPSLVEMVAVCHRTGQGNHVKIGIADAAYQAHVAHGDKVAGGGELDADCQPQANACYLPAVPHLTVTIIESTTGRDMDVNWVSIAQGMGHSTSLVPATALDDIANLSGTDVLVISDAGTALGAERIATVQAVLASGRGVYVQAEYQATFQGNQAFEAIVNSADAGFSWGAEVPGTLAPTVLGCFGEFPEVVSGLSDLWYGLSGTGTGVGFNDLLDQEGQAIGFSHCLGGGQGLVVTTTDQDWMQTSRLDNNGRAFVRNIISRLAHACPG